MSTTAQDITSLSERNAEKTASASVSSASVSSISTESASAPPEARPGTGAGAKQGGPASISPKDVKGASEQANRLSLQEIRARKRKANEIREDKAKKLEATRKRLEELKRQAEEKALGELREAERAEAENEGLDRAQAELDAQIAALQSDTFLVSIPEKSVSSSPTLLLLTPAKNVAGDNNPQSPKRHKANDGTATPSHSAPGPLPTPGPSSTAGSGLSPAPAVSSTTSSSGSAFAAPMASPSASASSSAASAVRASVRSGSPGSASPSDPSGSAALSKSVLKGMAPQTPKRPDSSVTFQSKPLPHALQSIPLPSMRILVSGTAGIERGISPIKRSPLSQFK